MIKTENFWIGFEYPRTPTHHGVIYFQGEAFANTWVQPLDWGKTGGKWIINRDGKAFELHFPPNSPGFDSAMLMLEYLESWYKENVA